MSHARTTTRRLCSELGGQARFDRLKAAYKSARPKRGRGGPCILTADEVFREKAREDGFSEEDVNMFIQHVGLRSSP